MIGLAVILRLRQRRSEEGEVSSLPALLTEGLLLAETVDKICNTQLIRFGSYIDTSLDVSLQQWSTIDS